MGSRDPVIVGIGWSDYPVAPELDAMEHHAMALGQPRGDLGNGLARFDPKIDGALQDRLHIRAHEPMAARGSFRTAQNTASLPHFGAHKRFEHRRRFRTPGHHP